MLVYLTLGITLGFTATVQPGPFLTYIVSQTIKNGWRSTIPMAFAPILSDIPVAILILLILSQMPAWLVSFLRLAGGFFLLYLAFGAFKTWRGFNEGQLSPENDTQHSVFNAVLVNWLNPAPYLGWSLILGPLFLQGWQEMPVHGMILLGGFYGTMVVSLAGIIVIFSATSKLGLAINKAMIGLTAIALAGFGIYQLWLGFSGH